MLMPVSKMTVVVALGLVVQVAAAVMPAPMKGKAPELAGKEKEWINAPGGPLHLKDRQGMVTIVHFWTFGCINCKRNLPIYDRWAKRFAGRPVEIIGIHTPEFPVEAVAKNVERKVLEFGITYPVLLDPDQVNWRRWNQQFWPAVYLIDKKGMVRYRWDGEMNYGNLDGERKMTSLIETLLREEDR